MRLGDLDRVNCELRIANCELSDNLEFGIIGEERGEERRGEGVNSEL